MSDRNVHGVHEDREGIFDEGFESRSSCAEVFEMMTERRIVRAKRSSTWDVNYCI